MFNFTFDAEPQLDIEQAQIVLDVLNGYFSNEEVFDLLRGNSVKAKWSTRVEDMKKLSSKVPDIAFSVDAINENGFYVVIERYENGELVFDACEDIEAGK